MRWVMALVLPVPAPASTHTGPFTVSATARCSGSSPSSTDSANIPPYSQPAPPASPGTSTVDGRNGSGASTVHPRADRTNERGRRRSDGDADDRPGREPDRPAHHVHDVLVRVLPPAQEPARPRRDRDGGGRHRARPGGRRLRHERQRRQHDRADDPVPRRLRRHQPQREGSQAPPRGAPEQGLSEDALQKSGIFGSSPPYQRMMSWAAMDSGPGATMRPSSIASRSSSRVYQAASRISSGSGLSGTSPSAFAVKPSMRLCGSGHGWLPR